MIDYVSFKLPKYWLIAVGAVSVVLARTVYVSINDPEGPNVPVVLGTALVIYVVSVGLFRLAAPEGSAQTYGWIVAIQFVVALCLWLVLR